ncbi:hypothetical protein GZH53_12635 [Flavihumibacter sp. R14]|nr:hypothetical protein [Flavihumibacter soli]
MKTNHYRIINGTKLGFGRAITFDHDKRFVSVILVALSADELKKFPEAMKSTYALPAALGLPEMPPSFPLMLRLMEQILPDPLPAALRELSYAGCLQREIYLS